MIHSVCRFYYPVSLVNDQEQWDLASIPLGLESWLLLSQVCDLGQVLHLCVSTFFHKIQMMVFVLPSWGAVKSKQVNRCKVHQIVPATYLALNKCVPYLFISPES